MERPAPAPPTGAAWQGVAFGIFYSLFAIPIGFLVDRRSRRWILSIGVALWSLATIACGNARGFAGLLAHRGLSPAGEARTCLRHLHDGQHARHRARVRDGRDRNGAGAQFSWAPLLGILGAIRLAYFTMIAGTVGNLIFVYAQLSRHPTMFIRVHRWSAAEARVAFGAAVLPIGILSSIAAGWLIDGFTKRGGLDAPLLVMFGHAAILATFGSAVSARSDARGAHAAFAINTISASWPYAAALAALNQVTPNECRGQITGVYTLVTGLVSMEVGAFAVGLLSDHGFTGPEGIGQSITAMNLAAAVIAALILVTGLGSFREAVKRADAWTGR